MPFSSPRLIDTMAAIIFKKIFLISVPAAFAAGFFNLGTSLSRVEGLLLAVPQLCLFHRFTGLLCPGCGMTRGMISFFSYDLEKAFYFHPLAPLLGALIVAAWFCVALGYDASVRVQRMLSFVRQRAVSVLILLVAWTVLRNVSF